MSTMSDKSLERGPELQPLVPEHETVVMHSQPGPQAEQQIPAATEEVVVDTFVNPVEVPKKKELKEMSKKELRLMVIDTAQELHDAHNQLHGASLEIKALRNDVDALKEEMRALKEQNKKPADKPVAVAAPALAPETQEATPPASPPRRPTGPTPPAQPPQNPNNHNSDRRRGNWIRTRTATALALGALVVGGAVGYVIGNSGKDKVVSQNVPSLDKTVVVAPGGLPSGEQGSDQGGDKTPALTPAQKAAKARVAMLDRTEEAKTVPGAVVRLKSTPDTVNKNVRWIHNTNQEKQLLHPNGEMNSIDEMLNVHALSNVNAKEALAFGFEGSAGYTAASYNVAHGRSATAELPEGVSAQEAQAWLNAKLAEANGNVTVSNGLQGVVKMNHGQRGETVFEAGRFQIKGPVVLFDTGDVTIVYKLDGNGCLNVLTTIPNQPQKTVPPVTNTTPSTPKTTPEQPNKPHKPQNPERPTKPEKPERPTKPEKPGEKNPPMSEKNDKNTTPGGVPGQNGGTPDKAGVGPAGQTPGADGFVPGETRPTTPTPEATPAPLPNAPAPTAPAQEGTPTTAPAEQAQGADTPAPTTNPDPQG